MILPWDSDSGTCPGPAEQILGETFPESLHMSLPHILPKGVRRGEGVVQERMRTGTKTKEGAKGGPRLLHPKTSSPLWY